MLGSAIAFFFKAIFSLIGLIIGIPLLFVLSAIVTLITGAIIVAVIYGVYKIHELFFEKEDPKFSVKDGDGFFDNNSL